jgi:hypothetical protein
MRRGLNLWHPELSRQVTGRLPERQGEHTQQSALQPLGENSTLSFVRSVHKHYARWLRVLNARDGVAESVCERLYR